MKKGRRIGSVNGEIPLPEGMIHHIQSFMSGKEAARSTLISKSWYDAWLTRPSIDLDDEYFRKEPSGKFKEFAIKTMQRYQDSTLKIDSFRLRSCNYVDKLIVNAIKMGATNLQLVLSFSFIVPQEVLGSKTLLRLSICRSIFKGNYVISCSTLKSLVLKDIFTASDDLLKDISRCCISLEELSLSSCFGLKLISRLNLYELPKLRRLYLSSLVIGTEFFTDFGSRFPCLTDLTIDCCRGFTIVRIATTSVQTISFKPFKGSWKAKFDVPNIRKFTYSGSGLPSPLSIKAAASREWEFDISITCNQFYKSSWFLNLKKYLSKFRLLRINLSVYLSNRLPDESSEKGVNTEVEREPLVVENLMIDGPPSYCRALVVRLFGICRPKFITHYWLTADCYRWSYNNVFLDILCKKLMQQQQQQQRITPNCCIPPQKFGLKKVSVEVYELFHTQWRLLQLEKPLDATVPPENKRKVRFELIWD